VALTIEIAPEVERALNAEAERRDITVAALVNEILGAWASEITRGETES